MLVYYGFVMPKVVDFDTDGYRYRILGFGFAISDFQFRMSNAKGWQLRISDYLPPRRHRRRGSAGELPGFRCTTAGRAFGRLRITFGELTAQGGSVADYDFQLLICYAMSFGSLN